MIRNIFNVDELTQLYYILHEKVVQATVHSNKKLLSVKKPTEKGEANDSATQGDHDKLLLVAFVIMIIWIPLDLVL